MRPVSWQQYLAHIGCQRFVKQKFIKNEKVQVSELKLKKYAKSWDRLRKYKKNYEKMCWMVKNVN